MMQRGLRKSALALCVLEIFLGVNPSFTHADEKKFVVEAALRTDANDLFEYDGQTGELFRKALDRSEQGSLIPIRSFGKVPGLKPDQIEILASSGQRGALKNRSLITVIRHGHWVSIVDTVADRVLVDSVGPFVSFGSDRHGSEIFNRIVRGSDGVVISTFNAEVVEQGLPELKRYLVVLRVDPQTSESKVGWLPLRTDSEPSSLEISVSSKDTLEIKGSYNQTLAVRRKDEIKPELREVELPVSMSIDLKDGKVESRPGEASFGTNIIRNGHFREPYRERILAGMFEPSFPAEVFMVPGVSAGELAKGAQEGAKNPTRAAVLRAQDRIAASNAAGDRVRQGLKGMYGQEAAVDTFVNIARKQSTATKFSVVVVAGPTPSKLNDFERFIKSQRPGDPNPVFSVSLAEHSEKAFFRAELFGSRQGYIGMGDPTGLMLWLLEHPDGGGIFFDHVDATSPEVLKVLTSFLEKGNVTLIPPLVAALCEKYKEVPVEQWPKALREGTQDGANKQVEITLTLSRDHVIGLGSYAGAALYTGADGSNISGDALKSEQDFKQANSRFNSESIRAELRSRGYSNELLNLITDYIPIKVRLKKDHAMLVEEYLSEIQTRIENDMMVKFELVPELKAFLVNETYAPLEGDFFLKSQLDDWISQKFEQSIREGQVSPGDRVLVRFAQGDTHTLSSIQLQPVNKGSSTVASFEIGRPLPVRPTELLERARTRLRTELKQEVLGHDVEIDAMVDRMESELVKAVKSAEAGRRTAVVLYVDGPSGNGKTELARKVAKILFDDPNALKSIKMNNVVHESDFHRVVSAPLAAATKSNSSYLVALLDELPRMGENSPSKHTLQNYMLSVFDELRLPPNPAEARMVNGLPVYATKETSLPPFTVFIATGNMFTEVLGDHAEFMTNRELMAHYRLTVRHPEKFRAQYTKTFSNAAFRSRLGEPTLYRPLDDQTVERLRDRFFDASTAILRNSGVAVKLSESAKKFFLTDYIPIRGARWVLEAMEKYVEAPLNVMFVGNEAKYSGAEVEVVFDTEARRMTAVVRRDGKIVENKKLSEIQRSVVEMHPEAREKAAWETSVHEAGHAIVRRALYGRNSVAEINTFGGGDGGWMEPAVDIPTQDVYPAAKKGPYRLAVGLGGHIAEVLFLKDAGVGASTDFSRARALAQTMLLDGGTLNLAPIPLVTNPSTGQVEFSPGMLERLEKEKSALLDYSARLTEFILKSNALLVKDVARALHKSANMQMSRAEFEQIVAKRIKRPSETDFRRIMLGNKATAKTCESLLTQANAIERSSGKIRTWFRSLFQRNK
ncbi:MAG: AAA family ATPase [Bdellovibrionota bacterium]